MARVAPAAGPDHDEVRGAAEPRGLAGMPEQRRRAAAEAERAAAVRGVHTRLSGRGSQESGSAGAPPTIARSSLPSNTTHQTGGTHQTSRSGAAASWTERSLPSVRTLPSVEALVAQINQSGLTALRCVPGPSRRRLASARSRPRRRAARPPWGLWMWGARMARGSRAWVPAAPCSAAGTTRRASLGCLPRHREVPSWSSRRRSDTA